MILLMIVHASGGSAKSAKSSKGGKSSGGSLISSRLNFNKRGSVSRGRTAGTSAVTRGRTAGGAASSTTRSSGGALSTLMNKGSGGVKPVKLYTGKTIMPGSVRASGVDKEGYTTYTAKDAKGKTIKLDGTDMGAILVSGIDRTFYK